MRMDCKIFLHVPPQPIEIYFLNVFKSTENQIVFTIFRLIWNKNDFHFDQNQSENGKYNLILGWFNKIQKRFICMY